MIFLTGLGVVIWTIVKCIPILVGVYFVGRVLFYIMDDYPDGIAEHILCFLMGTFISFLLFVAVMLILTVGCESTVGCTEWSW